VRLQDRRDAGRRLAAALEPVMPPRPFVAIGLARGGVVVAAEVARRLPGALEALVVKKIGAPGNPEAALGAAVEDGTVYLEPHAELYLPPVALEAAARAALERARAGAADLRGARPPGSLEGRTAVLVDDGAATGSTMIAAIRAVAGRGAAGTIVALPVASPEACERLRAEPTVDSLVCLAAPEDFYAVGQYYDAFDQVEDDEVKRLLAAPGS